MNDNIMIVTAESKPNFTNKKLNICTNKIFTIGTRIKKNLYEISAILAKVDAENLYEDDGFKSAADYAQKVFGFKKTMAYSLLKIGKDYTAPELESNLPHEEGKDFSVSQVEKLLPLNSHEEAENLVNSGEVKPDMSCKQIAEVVKSKIAPVEEEAEEESAESCMDAEEESAYAEFNELEETRRTASDAIIHLFEITGDERYQSILKELAEIK